MLTVELTVTLSALIEARFCAAVNASRLAAESPSVMLCPGSTENDGSASSVIRLASVRVALVDSSTLPALRASGVPAMASKLAAVSNTAIAVASARPAALCGSVRNATVSRTT